MKKITLKRLLAAAASAVLVSAMAASALTASAFDTPTLNESPATVLQGTDVKSSVDITLNKDIVLFNVDQSDIFEPNITYTYEITSATGTNTITTYATEDLDDNGDPKTNATPITITVRSGLIGAISTSIGDNAATADIKEGTITFGADNETKYATNEEYGDSTTATIDLTKKVRKNLTITVDANKIYDTNNDGVQDNGPGVYRYKITDATAAATYTASGVADGDAANDLYLDVYTRYTYDASGNPNGLEIYGYVLMTANESIAYDGTATEVNKVTGYDTDSENKDIDITADGIQPDELVSDTYHTYNVEVKKVVDGALADPTHNFPFKVELSNTNTVTSLDDFYYVITKDGSEQSEVITMLGNDGTWTLDGAAASTNLQLQHGDSILITGLPVNTQIKVTETNDTADTYTVSAKDTDENPVALNLSSVAPNGTTVMNNAFAIDNDSAKDTITFTNTLKEISVTGIMFTVAPFALILLAGVILYVVYAKNRRKNNEEVI